MRIGSWKRDQMAKILTFPKDRASSLSQQPAETTSVDAQFVVSEADGLLSFSRHDEAERQTSHPRTRHDCGWSNQELASIYRVKHLLDAAKMRTELDRGVSDEGDPWCVFCNINGEIFIHLSRIDGLYWLDSPNLTAPLNGSSFDALVSGFTSLSQKDDASQAEAETKKKLVRLRSSDTLFLHPSVMLAALVWSLYFGSEEILLFGPQDDAVAENKADQEANAAWLHETSHDLKNGALTTSAMAKGDEVPWHDLHTNDLQKSLLMSGAQSHIGLMLGLGSVAVASGLISEGQWKEIFSSILRINGDQDTKTAVAEDGASTAYSMFMLTQSFDLVANFISGSDAEYAGENSESSQEEIEAAPISLIVTKLAELFGLDETNAHVNANSLEIFQNQLKIDIELPDVQPEYAVLEGKNIFLQEATSKSDGENELFQSNIITNFFGNLLRDSDLAVFEFEGMQYLADFSFESLKAQDAAILEQVLSDSEQTLTAPKPDTALASVEKSVEEPVDASITSDVAISDTTSHSLFPTFDDKAKDFFFEIFAREDVQFITSATSFIVFDLGAFVESDTELAKMTWQTDDGMTVSLLGAKADFVDYEFV